MSKFAALNSNKQLKTSKVIEKKNVLMIYNRNVNMKKDD